MRAFSFVCLTACASSTWQSADEACSQIRSTANACHERTARIEALYNAEWPGIAEVYPGSGDIVVGVLVNADGEVTQAEKIEASAGSEVLDEVVKLIKAKAPYKDAASSRFYVRFRMRPPSVALVTPLAGDSSRVVEALKEREDAYFKCYQEATRFEDMSFDGELVVKIGLDGRPKEVRIDTVSRIDEQFQECVIAEAKKISVPARIHAGQTARLQLTFQPRPKAAGGEPR